MTKDNNQSGSRPAAVGAAIIQSQPLLKKVLKCEFHETKNESNKKLGNGNI